MCVWGGVPKYGYADARGSYLVSSIILHLIPFRQGLSLNWKLTIFARLTGQ